MGADDSLDERQAKSSAVRPRPLYATLKHVFQYLRGNAGPVVFKQKLRSVIGCVQRDADSGRRRQMFEFIVKKIGYHPVEQSGIGRYFQWGRGCKA